jgi:hypothetical protein
MTTQSSPPPFAEAFLRLFLAPRDRESVSGDLLEEYRESIHPSRGQAAADRWYFYQVLSFFLRSNAAPAILLLVAILGRTAFDWLVPTAEFTTRSTVSTLTSAAILIAAGFLAASRSHRASAGTVVGAIIPLVILPFVIMAMFLLLAFNHDPTSLSAIRASGGLSEAFTFPLMLTIPGAIFGTMGGVLARGLQSLI